jgi:transcriptional regulator GlxA family with amidase domain
MKHCTIVVPEGENNLSSIVGAFKIFTRANDYWKETGRNALFRIELAGLSKQVDFYGGLFAVKPHTHISAIAHTDLIIVPSLNHNYQKAVKGNKPLIEWIEKQYKDGAEIASICTGAFLLASSGLLDGKTCSTHWAAAENFRSMFPKVKLQPSRVNPSKKFPLKRCPPGLPSADETLTEGLSRPPEIRLSNIYKG